MASILKNEELDSSVMGFDDEIDCACLSDEDFQEALADVNTTQPTADEEVDEDSDELADLNMDYTGCKPDADIVDQDADDLLATERDVAYDVFEDEDLIDAAVGDDEPDFDEDDDEDIDDNED